MTDPFEIPEFLRREVEESPKKEAGPVGPAKAKPPPATPEKGVARQDKSRLRDLGYSDEQIAYMTRREAEYAVTKKTRASPPTTSKES